MKTVKFFTLGCKVNQYDTQRLREQLLNAGLKELANGKPADMCVINTCTVTHRADADSLGLIRKAQRENPRAKIVVAGCLTTLDSKRIREISPRISIIKNKEKDALAKALRIKGDSQKAPHPKGISYFEGHTRAFLKIQDGCNNFCSYCKVPLVRGKSRSRPLQEVKEEVARLVAKGFKEIVLCGICLGAYGKDLKPKKTLVDVINALEEIEGLLRIRLSSIEAADVSDVLIDTMARSKKLCRHLHIPIQSGDDEILKKMHRRYTRGYYLGLVKKLKKRISEIAITTDVLLGFPGEGENHFQNTRDLVKKIMPLKVHIFPYSRREGTRASRDCKEEVSPCIIKERIAALKKLADSCAASYMRRFLKKTVPVLIENESKEPAYVWEGHSEHYVKVMVKTGRQRDLHNQLIPLKVNKIEKNLAITEYY